MRGQRTKTNARTRKGEAQDRGCAAQSGRKANFEPCQPILCPDRPQNHSRRRNAVEPAAPAPVLPAPRNPAVPAPAADRRESVAKEDKKPRNILAELAGGGSDEIKVLKAKGSKNVTRGIVHVLASFNNTMVTITDANGNVIGWSSAGKMGFKGSPQEHRLRRPGRLPGCLPPGDGPRPEGSRSPRQGPGFGP